MSLINQWNLDFRGFIVLFYFTVSLFVVLTRTRANECFQRVTRARVSTTNHDFDVTNGLIMLQGTERAS